MSLKIIDRKRGQIRTNSAKINNLIHETAMMIIKHAAPKADAGEGHGDCTRAQMILFDLPASFRRSQLALWFSTYTPIVVKETKPEWNAKMLKPDAKAYVAWDLEAAAANPWFTLAEANPEKPALTFEQLVKMVEQLSARINKSVEDGKVEEKDRESAKIISARLAALKFERIKANDDQPVDDVKLNAVG